MTAIGNNKIEKIYLGSNEVSKMYLGSDLVYQNVVAPPNYLCFTALADGTFTLTIGASVTTGNVSYIEYSLDDGETWVKTDNVADTQVVITTPTVTSGNKVLWRGSATKTGNSTNSGGYSTFSSSARFNVSGHICSLLYGDNSRSYNSISTTYTFVALFLNATRLVSAEGLVFPNNAPNYCYAQMFMGCTALTTACETLPATTINQQSYNRMYSGCSNLLESPAILCTNAYSSYSMQFMFQNCSKLSYIMCMISSKQTSTLTNWVYKIASSGIFVKNFNATWTDSGNNGVPSGWTVIYYNTSTSKYYLSDKTTECDENGNPIS